MSVLTPAQKRQETIAKKNAWKVRSRELRAEGLKVVATGKCPQCGAGIHQNLSITGWWQCDRSGDGHFRRDQTGAKCSWQVIIPREE